MNPFLAIYVILNVIALLANPMAGLAAIIGLPTLYFAFYWFLRLAFNIDLWR